MRPRQRRGGRLWWTLRGFRNLAATVAWHTAGCDQPGRGFCDFATANRQESSHTPVCNGWKNAARDEGSRKGKEPRSRGQRRTGDPECRCVSTGDYRTGVVGFSSRTELIFYLPTNSHGIVGGVDTGKIDETSATCTYEVAR